MKFGVFQVSRRGGREKNEDRMGYAYTRDSALFALADGMGGHPEGEMAAQIALQTLASMFQAQARPRIADPMVFLREAVMAAHQQLLAYAKERGLEDTPRTTVVACIAQGGQAFWAHCGDSRLYWMRRGELVARTRDHSYSELQEALGRSNADKVNRNVLFTCLGSPGRPMVDIQGPLQLSVGDRLLLCSDGLWGQVSDHAIVEQVSERDLHDAVPDLVEMALRKGGTKSDNVTVLAFEWEGEDPEEVAETERLSTRSLGESAFATTIQAAMLEQWDRKVELDDAEIDRQVDEINATIRRAQQRG
ncbi:serine/threonine protein phosphatase PrpC [Inhella inkyongensis]|uniref:Serine/threonine protein phosphatase PrpC n=1 Tax=Inhella inkyongensis TaxID=392593 RepID=A0A840SC46_9BURK|nr:PP2C family serine/threonine-protein phosphatase [Inhella inkyongensis]MBB5206031.1 serine/threonine protein phosphatase PrpC [Inhella inkyongensis]